MNWSIPVGEHGPTIIALLVLALAWAVILREQRRRRLAAAAAKAAGATEGESGPAGPVRQSVALSREVVDHFRATGPGWQARIDEVLKRHVREEEERARRRVAEAEGAKARVAEDREAWRGEGK
jgi:uncharacterized protein (DUF4415 family)